MYRNNTISASNGNQTINTVSGKFGIAAGQTVATITSSAATADCIILCQLMTVDTTAKSAVVVPATGSFTITLNAAATGNVVIGFQMYHTNT